MDHLPEEMVVVRKASNARLDCTAGPTGPETRLFVKLGSLWAQIGATFKFC